MRKVSIIAALALFCVSVSHAATPKPWLAAKAPATAAKAKAPGMSTEMVAAYLTVDIEVVDQEALAEAGAKVSLAIDSIYTVRFPMSAIDRVASVPGVKYIQLASPVTRMLDVARPEVGITAVHGGDGLERPYTGKGVVVGIVDSGFDYSHAAFFSPEGEYRIKRVWEQMGESADAVAPEKYGYGIELTTPEQIIAAGGDRANVSHGMHVSSIAAGSDTYLDGALLGMAPDADIVLVSMIDGSTGNVNISDAIAYIFDYADEAGKPCVVNLSLGAHAGPHDGTSTFDVIADRLQGPGRLIVGSAGNHRADSFHVTGDFAAGQDNALRTFIDFKKNTSEGDVEVWAAKGMDVKVNLLCVKLSNGDVAERVQVYPAADASPLSVSLGRNISGTLSVASEESPLNGKPHVFISSAITSIRTGYAVAIEVTSADGGRVDIWADNTSAGLSSKKLEGYSDCDGASTICEIGGTAKRILTVGAYTSRDTYCLLGETTERKLDETVGAISSFSSAGPTADGRMKPQVAAPGCLISAAVSNNDNSGTLMISASHNDGERYHLYGFMQGTSMSSPMVAGIVATWLEAYPDLTPEDLVEIISLTARKDEHTGAAGDCDWGYGKIDALAGIKQCIGMAAGIGSVTTDRDAPIKVYKHGGSWQLMALEDVRGAVVEVYSLSGMLLERRIIDSLCPGDTVDLPGGVVHIILPGTKLGIVEICL